MFSSPGCVQQKCSFIPDRRDYPSWPSGLKRFLRQTGTALKFVEGWSVCFSVCRCSALTSQSRTTPGGKSPTPTGRRHRRETNTPAGCTETGRLGRSAPPLLAFNCPSSFGFVSRTRVASPSALWCRISPNLQFLSDVFCLPALSLFSETKFTYICQEIKSTVH